MIQASDGGLKPEAVSFSHKHVCVLKRFGVLVPVHLVELQFTILV